MAFYTSAVGEGEVGVFLPVYVEERQGAELINSQNYLVRQKHPEWRQVGRGLISSPAASIGNPVRQGVLRGPGQNLLVWRWHWVQGRETSNDYLAKAFQAFERLLGRAPVSADIVLFTQFDENIDQAAARLEVFADQILPGVRGALAGAGPTRGGG
jgi:EpsI family protein